MKICHILTGDTWGGAEAQALELMRAQLGRAEVCAIVFNDATLAEKLRAKRVSLLIADEKSRSLMSLGWGVLTGLKRQRPNVVHVHGFKEHMVAGMAARLLGIPIVRTYHGRGMIPGGAKYRVVEQVCAYLLTDVAIAVSRDLAAYLSETNVRPRQLRTIWNGIDAARFEPHHAARDVPSAVTGGVFHVGTVGRLSAVKNQASLLKAFADVVSVKVDARLTVVGDGPLSDELRLLAISLGIADHVEFVGFQHDVMRTLRTFDVFVLPSLHEGIPLALLEAMCAGVPVVCTSVGGVTEVIRDGENGTLVPPSDSRALMAAILKLANDSEYAAATSKAGRETVIRQFSSHASLESTLEAYEDAVTGQ